jgi:hypothetical protein
VSVLPRSVSYELSYHGQPVSSGLDLLRKCCGLAKAKDAVEAAFPNDTYRTILSCAFHVRRAFQQSLSNWQRSVCLPRQPSASAIAQCSTNAGSAILGARARSRSVSALHRYIHMTPMALEHHKDGAPKSFRPDHIG